MERDTISVRKGKFAMLHDNFKKVNNMSVALLVFKGAAKTLVVFFGDFGNMETDTQSKMVNIIYVALLGFEWVPKMSVVFLGICGNMETDTISIRNAKFGILDAQSKMVNIIYVALLMFEWEAKMSEVFLWKYLYK